MDNQLQFPANDTREEEGLNDPGIETFRHAPYESLARECGQNSADACVDAPVILTFKFHKVARASLPSADTLQDVLTHCWESVKGNASKQKEHEFFKKALDVVTADPVDVLTIEDRNTKGLVGPCEPGKPFHSLVKGSGVSTKDTVNSTGSFGIGKNAAFAASALRTVYYSTRFKSPTNPDATEFLAQGKSILMSHRVGDHDHRRVGYWGRPNYEAIDDMEHVPAWMRRDTVGASVHVAGFLVEDDWAKRIVVTVLKNFFFAIHAGQMEVVVDDIQVNSESLGTLFEDPLIKDVAEKTDGLEEFEFARFAYRALVSPSATNELVDVDGLGEVQITVLLADEAPKRVMFVRNGMKITDSLVHFGDRLAKFPNFKGFVAVVFPQTAAGSALLKDMENPQHNEFSAERISDAKRRGAAGKAMKRLARQVRETIRNVAVPTAADVVALDELSEFFAEHRGDNSAKGKPGEPSVEQLNVDPVEPSQPPGTGQKPSKVPAKPSTSGSPGSSTSSGGSTRKPPPPPAGEIGAVQVRNRGSSNGRTVFFTPTQSGQCRLQLLAAGIQHSEVLTVTNTDVGTLRSGEVVIEVAEGVRQAVTVRFGTDYSGPIEVRLVKEAG